MELKRIKPTAEVEFETETGKVQFTVAYLPRDEAQLDYQHLKPSEKVRRVLAESIVAWNLTRDDGTPWPCDAETKAVLLPQLVRESIMPKLGPGDTELVPGGVMLGLALYSFIVGEENFLKN